MSYGELMETFWSLHDPTTRDRQGWDFGSQYRWAIFFSTPTTARLPLRSGGAGVNADARDALLAHDG